MNRNCVRHRRLRIRIPGKTVSKGEAGFTMVEVLVALAILAITIIPLMGLFTMAPVLHQHREQKLRAGFLAQLRLEQVKNEITYNFNYQYPGIGYDKTAGAADDFPTSDGFEASDSEYKYTIEDTITDYNAIGGTPDPVMSDVTIVVWHDKDSDNVYDSNEQDVTIMTKIARRRL